MVGAARRRRGLSQVTAPLETTSEELTLTSGVGLGCDVVVEMEDVVGVVAALDAAEPLVVGPVRGLDSVIGLVVAEVEEPPTRRKSPPGNRAADYCFG